MIGYTKSVAVPRSLARGVAANAANCAAYDADRDAYREGKAKFDISSGIYGTKVVKRQLKADQHDKCGFCEALFDANVAGDVEHYRPKRAVETANGWLYPGYYWLGYDWRNLLYTCPDCNGYRKRNYFPLADEARRARDHHDNVNSEDPLILDPYGPKNPRDHIRFRGEVPTSDTPEGIATIRILGLDRSSLSRDRRDYLRQLGELHEAARQLEHYDDPEALALAERFRAKLAAAVDPRARFSAAAADHLAALDAGHDYLPPETLAA